MYAKSDSDDGKTSVTNYFVTYPIGTTTTTSLSDSHQEDKSSSTSASTKITNTPIGLRSPSSFSLSSLFSQSTWSSPGSFVSGFQRYRWNRGYKERIGLDERKYVPDDREVDCLEIVSL